MINIFTAFGVNLISGQCQIGVAIVCFAAAHTSLRARIIHACRHAIALMTNTFFWLSVFCWISADEIGEFKFFTGKVYMCYVKSGLICLNTVIGGRCIVCLICSSSVQIPRLGGLRIIGLVSLTGEI